jgi:hypothetical protein
VLVRIDRASGTVTSEDKLSFLPVLRIVVGKAKHRTALRELYPVRDLPRGVGAQIAVVVVFHVKKYKISLFSVRIRIALRILRNNTDDFHISLLHVLYFTAL